MQKGFSALHHASVSGHFEVAKMLSEKGALIDSLAKVLEVGFTLTKFIVVCYFIQEEKTCTTALILSCENGHKSIAKLLINKGANLNYQDKVRLMCVLIIPHVLGLSACHSLVSQLYTGQAKTATMK